MTTSHFVFNGQKFNSMAEVQAAIQGQMGAPAHFAQPVGMAGQPMQPGAVMGQPQVTTMPGASVTTYGAPAGQPQMVEPVVGAQTGPAPAVTTYSAPFAAPQVSYLPPQQAMPQMIQQDGIQPAPIISQAAPIIMQAPQTDGQFATMPGQTITYGAPVFQQMPSYTPAVVPQVASFIPPQQPQAVAQVVQAATTVPAGAEPTTMMAPQQPQPQIVSYGAPAPVTTMPPQTVTYGAPIFQQMPSYTPPMVVQQQPSYTPPMVQQMPSYTPPMVQQPQVIQQQPQLMQPQVMQPQMIPGQPQMMPGQPQVVPGQPQIVQAGQPQIVQAGQSQIVQAGQPQLMQAGQPQMMQAGQPPMVQAGQPGQPMIQTEPVVGGVVQPQQAVQAIVKQEVGPWQICEDNLGDYYVYLPSGQTFDQMPPELAQLLQQQR